MFGHVVPEIPCAKATCHYYKHHRYMDRTPRVCVCARVAERQLGMSNLG